MSKMHVLTLAALVSGSLASAIPSLNPFAVVVEPVRRRQELVSVDPGTCDSYVTVTVTPAIITATNTEFATTTAETVLTTDIVTVETSQDVTDTATITEFETSMVTETVTAATVTETEVVYQRKKKRGCGLKHTSVGSSAYPAQTFSHSEPASSSSIYTASSSASASISMPASTSSESSSTIESSTSSSVSSTTPVICTATITLEADVTTTTVTVTSSATAIDVETVTSTIIDTITTTVSTTEIITTIVPTTVSVIATASETVTVPRPTPTIILQASSGASSGQYLYLVTSSSSYSYLAFTADVSSATSFYLDSNSALVPTTHSDWVALYAQNYDSYVIESTTSFGQGGVAMVCQFGGSAVQVGDSGSFTCPNDGNSVDFWYSSGDLGVGAATTTMTIITINYEVIGVN